ncbi:hypothetical protein [Spirosoma terrae]|uniref:Uncharacterized protein n=1 Tax=Spirosoma terrae TaxID=1968276 RepID=A0A6L9L8T9_9BACT|nr:hypothetical protein [Spirosoma terrae]NDU95782.1 hypothetical protein [Spirosoma terrae]
MKSPINHYSPTVRSWLYWNRISRLLVEIDELDRQKAELLTIGPAVKQNNARWVTALQLVSTNLVDLPGNHSFQQAWNGIRGHVSIGEYTPYKTYQQSLDRINRLKSKKSSKIERYRRFLKSIQNPISVVPTPTSAGSTSGERTGNGG